MKKCWIKCLLAVLITIFFSIGIVSALSSNDVTLTAFLTNSSPRPGDQIEVNVTFDSKVAQQLQIFAIGIHADWMSAETLEGPTYSDDPVIVEANGVYSTRFLVTVPVGTSLGAHTYYVGVDGFDSSDNVFSINSAEATMQVVSFASNTSTPTPTVTKNPTPIITPTVTPTPTENSNSPTPASFSTDIVLIIAAVIIVLILCVTLVIVIKHKKTVNN